MDANTEQNGQEQPITGDQLDKLLADAKANEDADEDIDDIE